MATGLPDSEARNEAQQTNELDQLNETMSGVKDFLGGQLETLKAIARWQDQTALYTSHLQNIKIHMDQVRKWSEPINRIATRVDHMSTALDAIAAAQQPSGSDADEVKGSSLLAPLQAIQVNTRETADNINVLAMAIREEKEDKREVAEKVKPETESKKGKKEKEKAEGTVASTFSAVGAFFKKILGWLAASSILLIPLFTGSDKLFVGLKSFFSSVGSFFVEVTKFFMQHVVPAINFLFQGLVNFFNKLKGPLGALGTEIGNALRLIGPKLWNVVSPILDWLGSGIVKAVDFFTKVISLVGPAFDMIGEFVRDIARQFKKADLRLGEKAQGIMGWFESIFEKIMAADPESLMQQFRSVLNMMYNKVLDMSMSVIDVMLDVKMFLDDKFGPDERMKARDELTKGLAQAKIIDDPSSQVGYLEMFRGKSDEEIAAALRASATGVDSEGNTVINVEEMRKAETIIGNLDRIRQTGQQNTRARVGGLEKEDVQVLKLTKDTETVAIENVQNVLPNFPFPYVKAVVDKQTGAVQSILGGASKSVLMDIGPALDFGQLFRISELITSAYKNPDAIGVEPGQEDTSSNVPLNQIIPPQTTASTPTTPPVTTAAAVTPQINMSALHAAFNKPVPATLFNTPINVGGSSTSSTTVFSGGYNLAFDIDGFNPGFDKYDFNQ